MVYGSGCMVKYLDLYFFKQKTAYEMRSSDWSSDVCYSDLTDRIMRYAFDLCRRVGKGKVTSATKSNGIIHTMPFWDERFEAIAAEYPDLKRSEEHTSELQSLMRISYAVFCLKKKTTNNIT